MIAIGSLLLLVGAKAAMAMETHIKNPKTEAVRKPRTLAGDDLIASIRSKNRDEIGQLLAVMEPCRNEVRISPACVLRRSGQRLYPDSPKETGLPAAGVAMIMKNSKPRCFEYEISL